MHCKKPAPQSTAAATLILFLSMTIATIDRAYGQINDDEKVILFDTTAQWDGAEAHWKISLHGWVFEPRDAITPLAAILTGLDMSDVSVDEAQEQRLTKRAAPFFYDNERGKTIRVSIADQQFEIGETAADGHVKLDVILPKDVVADALRGASLVQPRLPVTVAGKGNQERHVAGWVYFVTESGLSVISDIDDTIKLTNVRDKTALMENTFLKEFESINGMSKAYRAWREEGVSAFHYVSASPWQLYLPLRKFLSDKEFPPGTMNLRPFRWADSRFLNLFKSPVKYKTNVIERLMERYPRRRFILVGDSTEADAMVYDDVARRFPDQVAVILIRNVPVVLDSEKGKEKSTQPNYEEAFKDISKNRWRVFDDSADLLPLANLIGS